MTAVDVITIRVVLKYDLLGEDECPGWVCSKKYPFLKKHNWYIVIVDQQTKEKVIQIEKIIANEKNEAKYEMKQRFGQAGQFKFHVMVMNDSYMGFDHGVDLEFKVLAEDPERVEIQVSKEDQDAIKGPGMVQSMLDMNNEESDDESSDDGVDALKAKLEAAGLKKATVAKDQAKKQESQLLT